jgi:hypothetical protein
LSCLPCCPRRRGQALPPGCEHPTPRGDGIITLGNLLHGAAQLLYV